MRIGYDAMVLTPPYSGVGVAVEAAALALARELGPDLTVFLPRDYAGADFPLASVLRAGVSGRTAAWRGSPWEQLLPPARGAARAN